MKTFPLLFMFAITANAANYSTVSSSYVNLVSPRIVPYLLGTYRFDTLERVTIPLNPIYPPTTSKISITAFIRSGMNLGEAAVNLWLWTECPDMNIIDTKFKRAYRYHQTAYSFDSETLEFTYCASNPELYVVTNHQATNVQLELYAVGYTRI